MARVIKFPPHQSCTVCGTKLRPAMRSEIEAGLMDSNATKRQAFMHAVQGDVSRKFVVENSFTASLEHETPPASWVLRCDSCGMTLVHMREEEPA